MKQKTTFTILIFVLLLSSIQVHAQEKEESTLTTFWIWIKSFFTDEVKIEEIKATPVKDLVLDYVVACRMELVNISYFDTSTTFEVTKQVCTDEPVNQSCSQQTVKEINYIPKQKQELQEICDKKTGVKYGNDYIDYAENNLGGCNVCGDELVCWHNGDGWSENRGKWTDCNCLSGERCGLYEKINGSLQKK